MFAPTKTWRRWHRKVNVAQKRYVTDNLRRKIRSTWYVPTVLTLGAQNYVKCSEIGICDTKISRIWEKRELNGLVLG
jgi:hypothetical protein